MVARTLAIAWVVLSSVFFAGVPTLRAQDQPPAPGESKPKPAGSTYPIPTINSGDRQDQDTIPLTPDTTPLTGVLSPTLGSPGILHSYWQPGIQWSGSIQSNSYNQTPNSGWLMNNYFVGNLSLLKAWTRSQLAMNYSAGGFVTTDNTQGSGYYQQLDLTQTFHWNRLQIQLIDQFSYLPQSSFGFGGGAGLGIPGTGGSLGPVIPGLGNGYVPNQGIFAAIGPRYSNSSAVQATYTTSARGSVTLSGSYGLLHFVDAGNVDNDTITGTVGYNYALTREDSIGVFYRFSAYHFSGRPEALGDHSVNVAYSRKITGRLALQLYGGPDFTTSRINVNGGSLRHNANIGASLQYAPQKGSLSLNFSHGVSGGSGVLTGSATDQISFGASHALSRVWSAQFNAGYSHNTALSSFSQPNAPTFNSWTVGGGINRPVGRNANLGINYTANLADYGLAGCTGLSCSNSQTTHYVIINFQWHARPFVLP